MSYLVIHGGRKLHGTIPNQPNKNSALAIVCACLMIKGKTTLVDLPDIEDVNDILDLLERLGVKVQRNGKGKVALDASGSINTKHISHPGKRCGRGSLFLWSALSSRVRKFSMPKSGGCHLGERTVRPHVYALQRLGVQVESRGDTYVIRNKQRRPASFIVMYESGDTSTENIIMAAVLARGTTTIKMASANYMVQDLCHFLNRAGAQISGIGTTTLVIEGVKALKPVADYPIMPDPVVAMTYIAAAITTKSQVTVANCPLEFLELELCKLEVMGQKFKIKNQRRSKNKEFAVADIEIIPSRLKALPDKIYGRPFPGLNIDNLPLFVPILTQAAGRTLVHDWVYENRALYFLELQKLGAKVNLIDAHRVWVEGPTTFEPNEIVSPPALRPAVSILLCMLAAKGISILRNNYTIDRGYERLYEVLNKAGAKIEAVGETYSKCKRGNEFLFRSGRSGKRN